MFQNKNFVALWICNQSLQVYDEKLQKLERNKMYKVTSLSSPNLWSGDIMHTQKSNCLKVLCRIGQETKSWKIYVGRFLPYYITNRRVEVALLSPPL